MKVDSKEVNKLITACYMYGHLATNWKSNLYKLSLKDKFDYNLSLRKDDVKQSFLPVVENCIALYNSKTNQNLMLTTEQIEYVRHHLYNCFVIPGLTPINK